MSKYERYDNDYNEENIDSLDLNNDTDEFDYLCCYSLRNDICDVIDNVNYKETLRNFIKENKDNIKAICDDIDHNIYVLLRNNELYINTDKQVINDIVDIVMIDRINIVGITSDNRIIHIIGNECNKILNNNEAYKKIIVVDNEIFALTNNNYLIINSYIPRFIIGDNLVDVDDIKYDRNIFVKKSEDWVSLD